MLFLKLNRKTLSIRSYYFATGAYVDRFVFQSAVEFMQVEQEIQIDQCANWQRVSCEEKNSIT